MKKTLCYALLLLSLAGSASLASGAATEEYTTYTIVQGDTLWGLSKRFLNDPYYWPNLWAAQDNAVGNPHFIYPGQRLRVYSDRIEVEPAPAPAVPEPAAAPAPAPPQVEKKAKPVEEPAPVREFRVPGAGGFLMEKETPLSGYVVATHHNRVVVGTDDIVYTDIGRLRGANVGDRFSVYKRDGSVSHPVTNEILGDLVVPLGDLQLSEMEDKSSRAIVTKAYQEISAGAILLPYRETKVKVPLRAAERDLIGYIAATQSGNIAIAVGDVVFLDLGSGHGLLPGNLLYIVRDVKADDRFASARIDKFPVEVLGALVVVDTGLNTSTAVIVKSVETIYRGDRVELKKSR